MGRRVTLMGIHEERDEGDGEMMVRAMGSIWEAYGKHMGSIWEAYGKHMGSIGEA